jgi:hemolysin III
MSNWNLFSAISDPFSSLSHFCGALLFAALGVVLLAKVRHDRGRLTFMSVFVLATVVLLTISGVYHIMRPGTAAREIWVRLDVSAIFILIASSFTFLHGCLFKGWRRWGILGVVWSIAIAGIIYTAIYDHASVKHQTRYIFLGMGWIGLVSCGCLTRNYGRRSTDQLMLGGCVYTLGAIIDGIKWPVIIPQVFGPHEILHLMVLLGVAVFWSLAFQIADGRISLIDRRKQKRPLSIAAESCDS